MDGMARSGRDEVSTRERIDRDQVPPANGSQGQRGLLVADSGGVDQGVTNFLIDYIDSVLELELLLLLRAHAAQSWTAAALAHELKIDPVFAAAQLEKFHQRKLLERTDQPDAAYRYAPASPELDAAVAAVAAAYASHRVSIIALIFSKPTSNLKSFADAFRIRKDKDKSDG